MLQTKNNRFDVKDPEIFYCEICGWDTYTPVSMRQHIRWRHKNISEFLSICRVMDIRNIE